MDNASIIQWWNSLQSLSKKELEENASSLSNLHNIEQILELQPLPELLFPVIQSSDLFLRKPAFKSLQIPDILFLRKCILTREKTNEITTWAEYLLRYLEINRLSIIKKSRFQFGSKESGRLALLELTALMVDIYFLWDDLRYLNLALKLMDMPGIFLLGAAPIKNIRRNKKLSLTLLQVRLMFLQQAAIEKIRN